MRILSMIKRTVRVVLFKFCIWLIYKLDVEIMIEAHEIEEGSV